MEKTEREDKTEKESERWWMNKKMTNNGEKWSEEKAAQLGKTEWKNRAGIF